MRLQEGETVIHELRPERAVLGMWLLTKCLPVAFAGAFLCFSGFTAIGASVCAATESDPLWAAATGGIAALVAAPVGLLLALIYCTALRKTYVYYVTDQRCVFRGGIIRRVQRSVPYHKVTDVEMSQNLVERILGISSLKIFTPGTGSMMVSPFGGSRAEISFVGLKDNETPAEAINGILRKFKATGE